MSDDQPDDVEPTIDVEPLEVVDAVGVAEPPASRPLRAFGLLAGGDLVIKLLAFATAPYIARQLQPAGYGQMSFVVSIVSFGVLFTNWGFVAIGTRDIARFPERYASIAGSILVSRVAAALIAYGALLAASATGWLTARPAVVAVYALVMLVSALDLSWVLVARGRPGWVPPANIAGQVVFVGIVFAFVRDGRDVIWLAFAYLVVAIISTGIVAVLVVRAFGFPSLRLGTAGARTMVRASALVGVAGLMNRVQDNVDIVVLHAVRGSRETGIYSAAYTIMALSLSVLPLASQVMFPLMSHRLHHDPDGGARSLRTYLRLFLVAAVAVSVGVACLAPLLLQLLGGSSYRSGADALRVLGLNFLASGLASFYAGYILLPLGRNGAYVLAVVAGGLTNLVLDLALVARFGMIAAAVATVGAQLAVAAVAYVGARRLVDLRGAVPVRPLLLAGAAGAAVGGALALLGLPVVVQGGGGLLAYGGVALLTGLIDLPELRDQLARR